MHTTISALPATSTVEQALALLGYVEGAPSLLDAGTLAIDKRIYSTMRCPACQRRGMVFRPWKRGREYRPVAVCRHCGHGEEV